MKDDIVYIEHILDAIEKILDYTTDLTYEQFKQTDLVVDAVIRNIEIIGEASRSYSVKSIIDWLVLNSQN